MITIAIADDHQLVRLGIRTLLERETGFSVVGEAQDGVQALRLVQERRPDVLVLDISMPERSGLDLIPELKKAHASMRVLMLTMHDNECYVMHALHQGADGYLLKETTGSDLVHGIRAVIAGKRYLSPQLEESVMGAVLDAGFNLVGPIRGALTRREVEALRFTVDGLSSTKIAQRMSISHRTVETHRRNLMRKLGVNNKAELIRHVLKHGFMHPKEMKPAAK